MNQKISNAPVIGMIVAIMLLTLSVGVNIWLYNENSTLDDIQEETIATLTIGELEYLTNMNWRCFAYAATVWDAYIQRGYTTDHDDDQIWRFLVCSQTFHENLYELQQQVLGLERR